MAVQRCGRERDDDVVLQLLSSIEESLGFMSTLSPTSENTDYCLTQLEHILNISDELMHTQTTVSARIILVRERAIRLHYIWSNQSAVSLSTIEQETCTGVCTTSYRNSSRGRPKIVLNFDQVELLRSSGFSWGEIAKCFLVSRSTLWRRVKESGLKFSSYTDVSNLDLDRLVGAFRHRQPQSGQSMLQGYLASIGINIQRQRVRESIFRVDPLNSVLRRHQPVTRRKYCVPGPNSLWHIDGHHSLIRWGLVIHGGIDGFSRLIVFLYCSSNNRSETVTKLFCQATSLFGLPSRVRSDRGGENVGVCEYMIQARGIDRGSHIAGSSVRNQRIERLWRDVFRCVCSTFYSLFYYLEDVGALDPENVIDRYVLHYVFKPRINQCLTEFACAWNHHPIRTERNWSPKKIWVNGVLDPNNHDLTAVRDIIDPIPQEGIELFGIDSQGPSPLEPDAPGIHVEDVECPLTDCNFDTFQQMFDPLLVCDDYGINLYTSARDFIHSLV